MSIYETGDKERTEQTTLDEFRTDERLVLADGGTELADDPVERRVDRALTEDMQAEFEGGPYWAVDSGSGACYRVDLFDPDAPECSCPDDAPGGYCKHVWRIFLFEGSKFLTDRIYGLGTGR